MIGIESGVFFLAFGFFVFVFVLWGRLGGGWRGNRISALKLLGPFPSQDGEQRVFKKYIIDSKTVWW